MRRPPEVWTSDWLAEAGSTPLPSSPCFVHSTSMSRWIGSCCERIVQVEPEERPFGVVTDDHLARLAKSASRAHAELKERRPELAGTLVAGVLAQGAAAHRVDPSLGVGVKDLDVWLFYARREGVGKVQERGRARVYDFGPSSLGVHPDDAVTGYQGRRVDVMTRTIDYEEGQDPADAVRAWSHRPAKSPRALRERPVVLLWPRSRQVESLWPGEPTHWC